jgi:hypothetical protein
MLSYGSAFLERIRVATQWLAPGNGAFLHSCVNHVASQDASFWADITVQGTTFTNAFEAWWNAPANAPAASHTHTDCALHDVAPYQCNPTCAND